MSDERVPSTELVPHDPFWVPQNPESMPDAPRAAYAFELRKAGADYDLIAEKLGYKNGATARQAVLSRIKKYYKENEKEIEEVVQLELLRLDQLQLICWRKAKDGDLAAVDRILKIMERRSKLLGLDKETDSGAGTVNQTAVFIGGTEQEFIDGIKQARELMNGN